MINKINEMIIDDVRYPLVFNLNVMELIQEKYGTIQKWSELTGDEEPNIKAIKFGIGAMINEAIDIENEKTEIKREMLTDKQVGRLITEFGTDNITKKMQKTVIESTEVNSKNE